MSPRTRLVTLAGVLALLGACGEPPRPLPTSPPLTAASTTPSAALPAAQPLPPPTYPPTYPTANPTPPAPPPTTRPTTAPTTRSPSPTPSHAARCATEPTGAQILTLIQGQRGVPRATLRVFEGPFCSGVWSFSTVEVVGQAQNEADPLMVVSTGRGGTLALVAAGSDVCIDRVQREAPPGIRVLACGF